MGSIDERLAAERARLGMTQEELAAAGNVTKRTQANYEAGDRVPDGRYLEAAAKHGLDVLFVITGRRDARSAALTTAEPTPPPLSRRQAHGVSYQPTHLGAPPMGGFPGPPAGALLVPAGRSNAQPLRLLVAFEGGQNNREFQVIPRHRATASAGKTDGRQIDAEDQAVDAAGVLAMDRTFMREQLGSDRAGFVTVQVKGDSMERTLIDGETIIIDSTVKEVDGSGIYVVQVGKNLLVKRLVLRMDGGVLVKSDNPAYAVGDQEFSAEQAQATIKVVGRMVWPKFR